MIYIPENYQSNNDLLNTNKQIKQIKDFFEIELAKELNLTRVSAPLMVYQSTGLNDNLDGLEKPVSFEVTASGYKAEIVHSLAKWKRDTLSEYGFLEKQGLYTDMNAIRKDEKLDNTHSIYVDQWDWEVIISDSDANVETLKETVTKIYDVLKKTEDYVARNVCDIEKRLPDELFFITSQELENLYPALSGKEREDEICKLKEAVFIIGIGHILKSGNRHDGRSPDYDNWDLNGDLLVWNPTLNQALELSSMGIRVDSKAMIKQLEISDCMDRIDFPFHQKILNNQLPQTIGGGIGQSRMCMYFLRKAHIGEVQAAVWDDETISVCKSRGIKLL